MTRRDAQSTNQSANRAPNDDADNGQQNWTEHEHVAESAKVEAQKLVDAAGTPELAKQAIDAASKDVVKDKDELASQLGFASFLEMFEASEAVSDPQGENFYLTCDRTGAWVVWSERTLDTGKRFKTRDDAKQFIRSRGEAKP